MIKPEGLLGAAKDWLASGKAFGTLSATEQAEVLKAEILGAQKSLADLPPDAFSSSSRLAQKRTETDAAVKLATPNLDKLTIDLTEAARSGYLQPVIGREQEMAKLIRTLTQKSHNNPVLTGEAGVGKTALVEGLALRIAAGDVPESLKKVRLLSLNMDALTGDTKYRGELESKTDAMLTELKLSKGNVILFIDEMHRITAQASGDANDTLAERLKPLLARGGAPVIGATTIDEFQKFITKDPALERRFAAINLGEPTVNDATRILRGRQPKLVEDYNVNFAPGTISAAIEYSQRYMPDRHLPDGPLGLMEQAANKVSIRATEGPSELNAMRVSLTALQDEQENLTLQAKDRTKAVFAKLKLGKVEGQITELQAKIKTYDDQISFEEFLSSNLVAAREKEEALVAQSEKLLAEGKLTEAHDLLQGPEYEEAMAQAFEAAQGLDAFTLSPLGRLTGNTVTPKDLASVIEEETHIPVMGSSEAQKLRLLEMDSFLAKRVIGQDEALAAVSDAVQRAEAGMADPMRPRGSFLFLGPTGVGKTETARGLADFLFGNPDALLRVDMSEFTGPGADYKLIERLTTAVRKNPRSVILLDEVEKADPKTYDTLLQVLDAGRLTDHDGKVVNFKNSYVAMTSNLPEKDLKTFFRPEFLGRIDNTVVFKPLGAEASLNIVDKFLEGSSQKLADQYIGLEVSPAARAYLAKVGFDPALGARPLRRAIEKGMEKPIARMILANELSAGSRVVVDVADGKLTFVAHGLPAEVGLGEQTAAPKLPDLANSPAYQTWLAKRQAQNPNPAGLVSEKAAAEWSAAENMAAQRVKAAAIETAKADVVALDSAKDITSQLAQMKEIVARTKDPDALRLVADKASALADAHAKRAQPTDAAWVTNWSHENDAIRAQVINAITAGTPSVESVKAAITEMLKFKYADPAIAQFRIVAARAKDNESLRVLLNEATRLGPAYTQANQPILATAYLKERDALAARITN